jgi:hypothetical protein
MKCKNAVTEIQTWKNASKKKKEYVKGEENCHAHSPKLAEAHRAT